MCSVHCLHGWSQAWRHHWVSATHNHGLRYLCLLDVVGLDMLVRDFSMGYVKPGTEYDPSRMARILQTVHAEADARGNVQDLLVDTSMDADIHAHERGGPSENDRRQLSTKNARLDALIQAELRSTVEQKVPSDPLYKQQWHLPKMMADYAWSMTTGSSHVVIAVGPMPSSMTALNSMKITYCPQHNIT